MSNFSKGENKNCREDYASKLRGLDKKVSLEFS